MRGHDVGMRVDESGQNPAATAIDDSCARRNGDFADGADAGDPLLLDEDGLIEKDALFIHRHDVDVDERNGLSRRRQADEEKEKRQENA